MTKRELEHARIHSLGLDKAPNLKAFYRVLILWFVLLALCIAWIHIDHAKADQINLSLFEIQRPTDEEINQKRFQLASLRDRLTDTDCAEIDEELDAWLDATRRNEDARVDEDNRLVAYMNQRVADYETEIADRRLDEIAAFQDLTTNHQR